MRRFVKAAPLFLFVVALVGLARVPIRAQDPTRGETAAVDSRGLVLGVTGLG